MSLTASEMTPADIRACTGGYGDDGMFGGNGAWWIIILLLFGWGGRGFGGGFGGGGSCATQADLSAAFASNATLNGINGIDSTLCQGFNGLNTAILQNGFNTQAGINTLSAQLAQCCCDNRAAIADVKYQMATDTCAVQNTIQNTTRDVIDNQNANSRAILDFLTKDKIDTLTAENQSLKLAASQAKQNAYLINELRPCPVPAYITCNPYAASYGNGNACNCGFGNI